jgi:hypothetical protein
MKLTTASTASLAFVAAMSQQADAHSWMDCVQLEGTTCRGYPRGWGNIYNIANNVYAQDTGRDNRPGKPVSAGLSCNEKEKFNPTTDTSSAAAYLANMYPANYPHTTFAPGQRVTMRWPAKNHATVGEQRGVQVFFSKPYTPATGAADDFSNVVDKASWVAKYPALDVTFTNCSPNQAGVDAAPCTGTFTVPVDLQPGALYTMMWWWEFNQGEFYNTCADVEIAGDGTAATTAPTAGTAATTAPTAGTAATTAPTAATAATTAPTNGNVATNAPTNGAATTNAPTKSDGTVATSAPTDGTAATNAPIGCVCAEPDGQVGLPEVVTSSSVGGDNTGAIVGGIAGAGLVMGAAMYAINNKRQSPDSGRWGHGYPPNAEQVNIFFQKQENL